MTDSKKYPNKIVLEKQYESLKIQREEMLRRLFDRFKELLRERDLKATLKYRVKSFESYYEKLLKKMKDVQSYKDINITDVLGFRIVCHFLEDLNIIEEILKSEFNLIEEVRKGYNQSFKEFGYDSIHFLIDVPEEIKETVMLENETILCEIQLRTTLQDAWAEVEHEIVYKSENNLLNLPIKRKLAALNANLTLSDIIFQEIRDYQKKLNQKLNKRRKTFFEKIEEENSLLIKKEHLDSLMENDLDSTYVEKNSIDQLLIEALSLHNKNDLDEAIKTYNEIILKNPEAQIQSIVFVHRGMAHFALSNFDQALLDFNKAITVKNFNPKAYYYKGLVNKKLENLEEALCDFSESIKGDPFNEDALLARSKTYFKIGLLHEALTDCEKALHINPDSKDAEKLLPKIKEQIK